MDPARRLGALLARALVTGPAAAIEVPVSTTAELIAAIDGAAPGHVITLAPGSYALGQNLICDAAGTAAEPIVVRAARVILGAGVSVVAGGELTVDTGG